ncbi:MAG: hypothetical protein JNK24_01480 [Alphaproteobacteria bacterium]|nr:hypothetical protein [Alphaproteobacteria bacterium]
MPIQKIDFRAFKKYFAPHAAADFNLFLEKLPVNVGKPALIAAGMSWFMVVCLGLFCVMQMKSLTDLRLEASKQDAIKPMIPVVKLEAVDQKSVKSLVDDMKTVYPDLTFSLASGNLLIQSKSTANYSEFREALGHIVNAGAGWKISVDSLCVGRECKQNALDAKLKIQKLKIDKFNSSATMTK